MMEAIGGYFELADCVEEQSVHQEGVLLNTGRNALEYILRIIGAVKCVYLPCYTCNAVLEPLKKLNIPWIFYRINSSFEIDDKIRLQDGEYIIANNYFGIKDAYIGMLAEQDGEHLIVDCAQALFATPIPGIKAFYSTRKFVGVADGGIAYLGDSYEKSFELYDVECTEDHDNHLVKRKQFGAEAGFADFQENEKKLKGQPIRWMSDKTKQILTHIDYEKVVARRRENFKYLHEALGEMNGLDLPESDSFACPMVYPFFTNDKTIKQRLINERIYVATYWPNVFEWCKPEDWEYQVAEKAVFLPIDQRYDVNDMRRIITTINNA